jgi:hypothetical protein
MAAGEEPPRRGHMHTTTVRFDAETWELLVEHCQILGVAHAEFIRGSVQRRLGALMLPIDRAARLERHVADLTRRVEGVTRYATAVGRFAGMPARGPQPP